MAQHPCSNCGELFERKRKTKTLCPGCKKEKDNNRYRDSQRRRRHANGARALGSKIACIDCGTWFVIESSSQKRCPGCQKEKRNKCARDRNGRNRHANGARALGSKIACIDCGTWFVLEHSSQKRCPGCQEKNSKALKARINAKRNLAKGLRWLGRSLGDNVACHNCGAQFVLESGRQKYCPPCQAERDRRSKAKRRQREKAANLRALAAEMKRIADKFTEGGGECKHG